MFYCNDTESQTADSRVDFSSLCGQKGEAIKFIPTFGILNSAVFCPLEAGYLIKACMHGWGRQGERKASLNPYFAVGGGEGGHSQV